MRVVDTQKSSKEVWCLSLSLDGTGTWNSRVLSPCWCEESWDMAHVPRWLPQRVVCCTRFRFWRFKSRLSATPTTQELFLYNVCFIYRLALAFAREITWSLSYRFLLTWNYWVTEIREETQWAESMRKIFPSLRAQKINNLLTLEGCAKLRKFQTTAQAIIFLKNHKLYPFSISCVYSS